VYIREFILAEKVAQFQEENFRGGKFVIAKWSLQIEKCKMKIAKWKMRIEKMIWEWEAGDGKKEVSGWRTLNGVPRYGV
jgi:hypothetical protein